MKHKERKAIFIIFIMTVLAFTPERIEQYEFPFFRVVIDPGHGGLTLQNKDKHGDKFDLVTGKYIDYFAEGAYLHGIYERDIVYNISLKVLRLLDLCEPDADFQKFKQILNKYSDVNPKRIYINTMLSRQESIPKNKAGNSSDPNAPFRLYDYPEKNGKIQKGRISNINSFKPHLVVSLHLANTAPSDYKGMNGIIVPPYNVLKQGILNLKNGGDRRINDYGILKSWFKESDKISYKLAYFKDSAKYFTGYGLKKNYKVDYRDFNGYKYNMVSWIFKDDPDWHLTARKHNPYTQYSDDYRTFKEEGRFWEREKSVYEIYRRGENFKNFGGDNYHATYEIIKYIFLSLDNKGINGKNKIPGKPFVSTWSMPLLINAISAYIELGYLDRKWDRDVLLHRQDEIAEGVAVGVYSLLAGMEDIKGSFKHKPSGKNVDFEKYRLSKDKTYFDIVAD